MLKIQYKHESLIFFCSKKNKTILFFSNILQCSWTECLSIWSTFLMFQPFPICRVDKRANFSQFRGVLPYSQNTALKHKCKVWFVWCFNCVKNIVWQKKYSCGTRNDPVFGYSNTSNICRLISKYLQLASHTNINIILQDFLYSFWVTTPLKWMKRCL